MAPNIKPRVSAVSYLNTVPLVWGLLRGPGRDVFDLRFELPAACAESVRSGFVDIGLVPVIEADRQSLEMARGLGIASEGPVGSILLIAKLPLREIRSLALDSSSRTSVILSRIVLAERFGVQPALCTMSPVLSEMLAEADCALLIGDPALRYDVNVSRFDVYDLGDEWTRMTGLPMVYAAWAGRDAHMIENAIPTLHASYRFGRDHIAQIAREEGLKRGFAIGLAEAYLTRHIVYELGDKHYEGLARFLELAQTVV